MSWGESRFPFYLGLLIPEDAITPSRRILTVPAYWQIVRGLYRTLAGSASGGLEAGSPSQEDRRSEDLVPPLNRSALLARQTLLQGCITVK